MATVKPYTPATRRYIHQLAAVMVCLEIEREVIAGAVEKATGKPYDRNAPDSFSNTFFSANAEYDRAWKALSRAIDKERKQQLLMARNKHGR
ncbi:hypothetical protein [Pectobacterium aroidearum]|uniref:hypothetical protein n=1 Tax=Pectobacterium aroidearum TaxID=1201031 RepID=UPI0032EC4BEA